MSFRFLAQTTGQTGVAIIRYGTSTAYDEAAAALCQSRLIDKTGNRPDMDALMALFDHAKVKYSSAPYAVKTVRILLGFHVADVRDFVPEKSGLLPDDIKGIVCYTKNDPENYSIDNLASTKKGVGEFMMWGALQSIQDECILSRRNFMRVWVDSSIGKEFYQEPFRFAVAEQSGQPSQKDVIMHTKILAHEELPSLWLRRKTPKVAEPHLYHFPDRTIPPAAFNA